jgi:hypothetical protein
MKHMARHFPTVWKEYIVDLLWKFCKVSCTKSINNQREIDQWYFISYFIDDYLFSRRYEGLGPVSSNKDAGLGVCRCDVCKRKYEEYCFCRQGAGVQKKKAGEKEEEEQEQEQEAEEQ